MRCGLRRAITRQQGDTEMSLKDMSLVASMLRNIRTDSINKNMLGHTIMRSFGPITREDIFTYVDATLDDPSRYPEGNCQIPPFYTSRLLYPMFRYFLINKELHLNILRLVHGYQSVEWVRPIRVGETFDVAMSVDEIVDTPAGELINLKTVMSVSGNVSGIGVTGFIVRGKGGGKGKPRADEPKREIFRTSFNTVEGQQLKYAEVSGDKNFIHTNNILAKVSGLPRTILHGVCISAMTANSLLDEVLGGEMKRMKSISMRFANPVLPGDEVTIVGYKSDEKGKILFDAVNGRGKLVLKNGEYRFVS